MPLDNLNHFNWIQNGVVFRLTAHNAPILLKLHYRWRRQRPLTIGNHYRLSIFIDVGNARKGGSQIYTIDGGSAVITHYRSPESDIFGIVHDTVYHYRAVFL